MFQGQVGCGPTILGLRNGTEIQDLIRSLLEGFLRSTESVQDTKAPAQTSERRMDTLRKDREGIAEFLKVRLNMGHRSA